MKKINLRKPNPESTKKIRGMVGKYGKIALGAIVAAIAKDISDAMKK
ncbi:MAG: hypothetical protein WCZ27_10290 [Tissierellaceae bacterium]